MFEGILRTREKSETRQTTGCGGRKKGRDVWWGGLGRLYFPGPLQIPRAHTLSPRYIRPPYQALPRVTPKLESHAM